MVSLADAPTRRIGVLLCAITAIYAIDGALTEISRVFFVPLALSVVQSFAASTGFAALLIGLLLTPFTPQAAVPRGPPMRRRPMQRRAPPVSRHAPRWLKVPLWLIALGILAVARARLRRPGALHRPATGADGHRRVPSAASSIWPSAP